MSNRWKRTTVTVLFPNTRDHAPGEPDAIALTVPAHVHPDAPGLAVTPGRPHLLALRDGKPIPTKGKEWNITHVPSGKAIGSSYPCRTLSTAKAFLMALAPLQSWADDEQTVTTRTRDDAALRDGLFAVYRDMAAQ